MRTPNPAARSEDRLARARRARGAAARARGTSRSWPAACPRGATGASPARAWPWSSGTPTTATPARTSACVITVAPGAASAARAKASAAGSGSLIAGGSTPGQAAEVGEEPVEREVAVAEDVALADPAALVGQQLPGGDVVGVDDVQRAVDVGGDPAAQEAAHELGRRAAHVAGAEHVRRVDDHHRQPLRGEAQRLDLGLALGVDVGQVVARGVEDLVLVGGRAAPRRADRGHRRRVHRRARPRPAAPPRARRGCPAR